MINSKLDIISDIHIDSYIREINNETKLRKQIKNYIEMLNPKTCQNLIIAGDLGHYNIQIKEFLKQMSFIYKNIFITFGNHDLYLLSERQKKRYKNSYNRINELKKISKELKNVYFMDGNIINIDNIKIGGCGMWYDFSYGLKQNNDLKDIYNLWFNMMNDSRYIYTEDIFINKNDDYFYKSNMHPLKFFEKEYQKLLKIINNVDIMFSHIGPVVPPNLELKYQDMSTSFYYFDGIELLNNTSIKYWIFGHTHEKYYFKINNTELVSNPLGYKSEDSNNEIINLI